MGKIFSYEEIEEGRVPSSQDFFDAKQLVVDRVGHQVQQGRVSGAKIFGSVGKGTPSIRSDFDLLVITEKDEAIPQLQSDFDEIYHLTRIAVEPIVITRPFAERGFHTIDSSFYQHLEHTDPEGNTIGTDPLDIMQPFDLPLTVVHKQYLAQKLRRLREGIFSYSLDDESRVLQRALEAPINTGRRTLQVFAHMGMLDIPQDDGKQAVIHDFTTLFEGSPFLDHFNDLLSKDNQYTSLVEATRTGHVSHEEYNSRVRSMAQEAIPQAVSWVSDISMIYTTILEGNQTSAEGIPYRSGSKEQF